MQGWVGWRSAANFSSEQVGGPEIGPQTLVQQGSHSNYSMYYYHIGPPQELSLCCDILHFVELHSSFSIFNQSDRPFFDSRKASGWWQIMLWLCSYEAGSAAGAMLSCFAKTVVPVLLYPDAYPDAYPLHTEFLECQTMRWFWLPDFGLSTWPCDFMISLDQDFVYASTKAEAGQSEDKAVTSRDISTVHHVASWWGTSKVRIGTFCMCC